MMKKDYYVIIAENDQQINMPDGTAYIDSGGPLVFEQYINQGDWETVNKRRAQLQKTYGKCRIAKLVFCEEEK